jgi:hypothetical protein
MDLTEGSETSAKLNQTPGKYPKENIQVSENGENLKSSILFLTLVIVLYQTLIPVCFINGCRLFSMNWSSSGHLRSKEVFRLEICLILGTPCDITVWSAICFWIHCLIHTSCVTASEIRNTVQSEWTNFMYCLIDPKF